jgi:hypothetical protein
MCEPERGVRRHSTALSYDLIDPLKGHSDALRKFDLRHAKRLEEVQLQDDSRMRWGAFGW